ncbi:hypothetical protein BT69DRAFT_1322158 [Atractiella rhizophila]|nr:hypothetical protein BT69DRAFT_1322158 [Atractiella rhizophila]
MSLRSQLMLSSTADQLEGTLQFRLVYGAEEPKHPNFRVQKKRSHEINRWNPSICSRRDWENKDLSVTNFTSKELNNTVSLENTFLKLSIWHLKLFELWSSPLCAIVDTACTAVEMSCVYAYTVTNWGNEAYLLRQVMLVIHKEYSERNRLTASVSLSVATHAVCDVAIATTLIVHLLLYRSKPLLQQTKKLLSTLCILAIESGTPTALITTCALITYLHNNTRKSLGTPGRTTTDSEFALPNSNEITPSMFMDAISVQHETTVQIKREQEHSSEEQWGEEEKDFPVKISHTGCTGGDFTGGRDLSRDLNASQVSHPQASNAPNQTPFTS